MDWILAAKRQGPTEFGNEVMAGLLGLDTRREAARTTEFRKYEVMVGLLGLDTRREAARTTEFGNEVMAGLLGLDTRREAARTTEFGNMR